MSRTRFIHRASLAAATMLTALPVDADTVNQQGRISTDHFGGVAGKPYQGDGLSVTATTGGARLRCDFQRLEGEVTSEGLWLISTDESTTGERFRVAAVAVGRETEANASPRFVNDFRSGGPVSFSASLTPAGSVTVAGSLVRWSRRGLTEEYSVSTDGIRQDFIVEQRPAGEGELRVELGLTGAKAEPFANGARLVLDGSGRRLAYSGLRVVDAREQELTARLEVLDSTRLAVLVDEATAVYPVRIDPTFSDADWNVMDGIDGWVNAAVADSAGNLYIGGSFTMVGDIPANGIAKWDGNTWTALGAGLDDDVWSLAVSGTDVYVGGDFSAAGGIAANHIAKWDGNSWSALGSGVGLESEPWDFVAALAVIGTDVYAAGEFTTAGGIEAAHIAKWDGNTWSALGTGLGGGLINLIVSHVWALAVVGTDLYVGGEFTTADGKPANYIAKWDGTTWSGVGSGMDDYVYALAVIGTDLYAGGEFGAAGGVPARNIAKWDGASWSALGMGVDDRVNALAAAGTDLYAGGRFSRAGTTLAYSVAKWDGSAWSALGSGMNDYVNALAVVGTNLYVGGDFDRAGDKDSPYLARANICPGNAAPGRFSNLVYSPANGFSGTFLDATPGRPYRIQSSTSLATGPWTDFTNFIYAGPLVFTDATAIGTTSKFYRAITP